MQNLLLETHRQLGANFFEYDGVQLVRDYGDVNVELHAATNESGIIDLSNYSVIRVAGESQMAMLEQALKADLHTLAFGTGKSKSILDSEGHLIANIILLAKESELWIYAETPSLKNFGTYIHGTCPDQVVSWLDEREPIAVLSVQGAFAADSLGRSIGKAIALSEFHWGAMRFFDGELVIVKHARTGVDGYDILVPNEHANILWEILTSNHARPFGCDAMNRARIETGLA